MKIDFVEAVHNSLEIAVVGLILMCFSLILSNIEIIKKKTGKIICIVGIIAFAFGILNPSWLLKVNKTESIVEEITLEIYKIEKLTVSEVEYNNTYVNIKDNISEIRENNEEYQDAVVIESIYTEKEQKYLGLFPITIYKTTNKSILYTNKDYIMAIEHGTLLYENG